MKIKINERQIDVSDLTCDGERVYMYAEKYKKMIVLKYATVFEAYNAYQNIKYKEIYDATGYVADIINK